MITVTVPGELPHAPGLSPDNLAITRNHPLASCHKLVSNLCLNLNVSKQLDDLRALQDGWLEGAGIAPPTLGLDWLSRRFEQHFPSLGVVAVTPAECGKLGLRVNSDPVPFPEHAVIDFRDYCP